MAKAHIKRPDGTIVTLDGTPAEIAEVLHKVSPGSSSEKPSGRAAKPGGTRTRASLPDLLGSLIDGGFFKKPKDLAAIKAALAELGHTFPVTTLSPAMIRMVRKRQLRRIKEDNRWSYTG